MKKIDQTVLQETKYIGILTVIFSMLLQAVFLIIRKWEWSVLFGNLLGAFGAVLNFFLMGITVQNAVLKEEKEAKSLIKFSQSARMLMLFIVAGVGFLCPAFHTIAVVIPLLFPRFAITLRPLFKKD